MVVIVSVDDRLPLLIALLAIAAAVRPVALVLRGAAGRDLIAVLAATGKLQLAYGLLVTLGMVLAA
jgi:1,4-dihydroxy-2-naphthoate octaprenyltransferase